MTTRHGSSGTVPGAADSASGFMCLSISALSVFLRYTVLFNRLNKMTADTSVPAELQSRFDVARAAALSGAVTAHNFFKDIDTLNIESKGFQDVVSNADRDVELKIRAQLESAFPDDGIIGEEHANRASQSGFTWVIDPIDGTANFVTGTPGWAVVIACVRNTDTVLGVIRDPISDETWTAIKGQGAFLNGRRINVMNGNSLEDGSTGVGFSNRVPRQMTIDSLVAIIEAGGIFYRNASGALMLAYVAGGRLLGYCEPHMNAWDCVAAILMVEEAGGKVQPYDRTRMLAAGERVVVATPGVYDQLVGITDRAFAA